MAVEAGYPVTLVHPNHQPAKIAVGRDMAVPEKFPAVMVSGADSEAQYRAYGYVRYGEAAVRVDYREYPKMLRHPEYEPAVPTRSEPRVEAGRIVGSFEIPGKPAHMPDVTVSDRAEEEEWREKGYEPAGSYDPATVEYMINRASVASDDEFDYEHQEYPKWVDGVLVERDPDAPPELLPDPEFPRFEGGVIVPDPRFPEEPDPRIYPMFVHRDGVPGPDSILVRNRREEEEARRKLASTAPTPEPEQKPEPEPPPVPRPPIVVPRGRR